VLVAEALSSLSRAHREVLIETVMRNRSVNEAADKLGIPLDSVKTRVYCALRALRIVLEERGVTSTPMWVLTLSASSRTTTAGRSKST
jgi:RNA polymerase sigma-70 factor (ECF subfamily)